METKWTYLLLYSPVIHDYNKVRRFLDTNPAVLDWYVCLPHSAFIVSELTAKQLAGVFRSKFPKGRFLVMDTATDRNGYLPKEAWDFMQKPKAAGGE